MICFVFNLLSSSPNLNTDNVLLYNYEKDHFWLFFDKFYETDNTIMYINSLKFFQSFNEKAYIWILLEFSQRNIDSIFEKIFRAHKLRDYYHYKENLIISKYLREVVEIFSRLKKINYKIKLDICENYNAYLRSKNLEKAAMILSDNYVTSNSASIISPLQTELSKKNSIKTSNFPFINRKLSHQDFLPLHNNSIFFKSTVLKRNTTESIRQQNKTMVSSFYTCSLDSNIQKRKQVIFELKKTLQSISSLNQELIKEIKETKADLHMSDHCEEKYEIKNDSPKIDFSFAEESMMANVGSKSPYNILEENPFGGFRDSPICRDNKIKYFTPEAVRTKSRISTRSSIEKNLGDLGKRNRNFLVEGEINFETVESESLIIEQKKKNSQILYEDLYLNNLGNDSRFQEKPKTIIKVSF